VEDGKMYQPMGYLDIYNSCRERIEKGELATGDRLPSIREFARSCSVSALTAQRAFSKLQQDGYIKSNGRHGCVVVGDWRDSARMTKTSSRAANPRLPLNVGLIVKWDEENKYTYPPLLSLERILTSRIYENGGSITRFILRQGNEEQVVRSALEKKCRILFVLEGRQQEISRLNLLAEEKGLRCIAFSGNLVCDHDCDTICVDDVWAFREIARKFVKIGHRKIAFVGLNPDGKGRGWVEPRIEGWKKGINESGGKVSSKDIFFLEQDDKAKGAVKMLRNYTAVVCANDLLAESLILSLRAEGLNVPGDVSVTGYDNMPRELVQGELTTVLIPEEKIASSFISLAQARMSNSAELGEKAVLIVRPIIIPRSSWGSIGGDR